MSLNPLVDYVYITDQGCFFNRKLKRKVSEQTIIDRLKQFSNEYEDVGAALECLQLIKSNGIKYQDMFEPELTTDALYNEVRDYLPFMWHTTVEGQEFLYYVTENREVTLILGDASDSMLLSLKAIPAAFDRVVQIYNESELLSKSKHKPDLQIYLDKVLKRLRLDTSKRLTTKPALLSWNSDDYAFKKFDPNQLVPTETPTWDEFCARLDYPDVFKAWIWSVFEPSNDGRQLLWIRGGGNDGKSRVISALMQIYGMPYTASLVTGDTESQFFYSKVYGKRFTVYDDCKNPRLISSEKIHSMLGKGAVSVEHKFGQPFTAEVFTKILVGSNYYPEIDFFRNNEKTRLICLTVSKYGNGTDADPKFTDKLIAEQYGFLHKCKVAYEAYCFNGVTIYTPPELIETMKDHCASENSKALEEFIDERIIFDAEGTYERNRLFLDLANYIVANALDWKTKFAVNDLKKLLEDKQLKLEKTVIGGRKLYVYRGIKPSPIHADSGKLSVLK